MRPLCRYCGKQIAKRTTTWMFGRSEDRRNTYIKSSAAKPRSKEEVAKITNMQLVRVRWTKEGEYATEKAGHVFIYQASVWDGESYDDPYFCNGEHARNFGYLMARAGHATMSYQDSNERALKKNQEKT